MDTIGETFRKKGKANPFLPDDLIQNILVRLPAKSAVRCRLVCRRWRDITLDRDFVDLQFKISIPSIFVAKSRTYSRLDLFALDKWWEPAQTSLMRHRFPLYAGKFSNTSRALFSHAGLVVFRENQYDFSKPIFTILNPTTRENVRITFSKEIGRRRKIFGVYFHPSLKEYCSLWMIKEYSHRDHLEPIQYKMLNLGSNPSFKNLSNPFSNRFIKMEHGNPLFINGYLYWMLESEQGHQYGGRNDIMEFDIISEEFTVMPCPIPLDTKCRYYQTHLLNIDGILSFLLFFPSKITIWKLEDHTEKFWTTAEYTFSIVNRPSFDFTFVELDAIAVVDGKLALLSEGRLFVCNLIEGTVKNYQTRKYNRDVMILSHQMSLASLKNCKPTIFIDEDGQVVDVS